MQLIAELYRRGLLSETLIRLVIQKLLWGEPYSSVGLLLCPFIPPSELNALRLGNRGIRVRFSVGIHQQILLPAQKL